MPYLQLAPRHVGNHAGRLAANKPFTGIPRVLLITTRGWPTYLTCGQTIMCIIIPRLKVIAKRDATPSFRSKYIARNQQHKLPSLKKDGSLVVVCPGAFSYVAHLGGNVPAWLVFIFQATGERFSPFAL